MTPKQFELFESFCKKFQHLKRGEAWLWDRKSKTLYSTVRKASLMKLYSDVLPKFEKFVIITENHLKKLEE